ncbi:dTDP-4-dehydrorhamnose reductase [Halomonas sp. JS92-SW72]|uniref:dTDP-4-dehydrorhamnose reductase n=1 Tax=Halomonas sp. JS92-SW72 TaxID=2306583 RepID=UPI000E5A6A2B|nr:dTDP-4-dehydrorhamnose reductase [Halomonas sp. JS92-SW72]AXY41413.1 dTDP-4-dehydrorhamnose reductase [Halomonas sp. JS92-SW72]
MKILITGSTGQVGFELQRQLSLLGRVLAPTRHTLDLLDARVVDDWLDQHRPDLIVNAAAYTAVDRAQQEPELAAYLNAALPAQLARHARQQGIALVHYSSDYVYSGEGELPWCEEATPAPCNVYGQSKWDGDEAIVQSGCEHLIFRTSWVYGAYGHNFMKTMLALGRERDRLEVVIDQIGAPTPARLIARITAQALVQRLEGGVYHLAPRGETSWHGFAQAIFRLARAQGVTGLPAPEAVIPVVTANYPAPAPRPLNSRLCLDRIETALGVPMPHWEAQLGFTLGEYLAGPGAKLLRDGAEQAV